MNKHARRALRNGTCKRAAAVVEMAVVTPLLLTLLFGVIEFGNSFMFRQILTNAAREGARTSAIQATADDSAIRAAVRDAMSRRPPLLSQHLQDPDVLHQAVAQPGVHLEDVPLPNEPTVPDQVPGIR